LYAVDCISDYFHRKLYTVDCISDYFHRKRKDRKQPRHPFLNKKRQPA
jgi:hypothetical protein